MTQQTIEVARDGKHRPVQRTWVPEAPVALEFNGIAYAVMMATPEELDDFACGFAVAEGLAPDARAVEETTVSEVDLGWIVRTSIAGLGEERLHERVRRRVTESSCGLCGIENLEAIASPLPSVAQHARIAADSIFAAIGAIRAHQRLGMATAAAHAAALAGANGEIHLVREDVGRHNALDKLVGAALRQDMSIADGFVISTARCSYEIVEKAVRAGATSLVTISLPTSLAVERASAAGLSLWALARDDSVLLVNDAACDA